MLAAVQTSKSIIGHLQQSPTTLLLCCAEQHSQLSMLSQSVVCQVLSRVCDSLECNQLDFTFCVCWRAVLC